MLSRSFAVALETTALVVIHAYDEPLIFYLSEKPEITFKAKTLKLQYRNSVTMMSISDVVEFHFEKHVLEESGIDEIKDTENSSIIISWIDKETINVYGLSPYDTIQLHTLTGRPVNATIINTDNDSATISLSNLNPGVYIISVSNKTSLKITKK